VCVCVCTQHTCRHTSLLTFCVSCVLCVCVCMCVCVCTASERGSVCLCGTYDNAVALELLRVAGLLKVCYNALRALQDSNGVHTAVTCAHRAAQPCCAEGEAIAQQLLECLSVPFLSATWPRSFVANVQCFCIRGKDHARI
jgi:hypothetical protein